jgi:Bacterial Ig domain/Cysteine-rich secretory protein family
MLDSFLRKILVLAFLFIPAFLQAATYSIGEPTDEEQLLLEYINRARADPNAEGIRLGNTGDLDITNALNFFKVNLAVFQSSMSALPPAPPLVMNPKLLTAARLHTLDMVKNIFQGHTGSNGSSPSSRISDQGYPYSGMGENVSSFSKSVLFSHAMFEFDWGGSYFGMQNPAGHRLNIHNSTYTEVGIGLVKISSGNVGPFVTTQDFARIANPSPFITGVVIYDLNDNNFYDIGEGIRGVTVTVSGISMTAVTSRSGGYAIPVNKNRTYTVTFTVPGLTPYQQTVVVSSTSVKVDYHPSFIPSTISGPTTLEKNQTGRFDFVPVGGAESYEWRKSALSTSVLDGMTSFQLYHPQPESKFFQIDRIFRPVAGSSFTFMSKLGLATNNQVAAVQISSNDAVSWDIVWRLAGSPVVGSPLETTFTQKIIPLDAYVGKEIIIRFAYFFNGAPYYNSVTPQAGFSVDEISFGSMDILKPISISTTQSSSFFDFSSSHTETFSLQVRPLISGRPFPWSLGLNVNIVAGTTENVAPLIKLITPVEGEAISGPSSISIEATAADSDGRISFVDFYEGNIKIARMAASPYKLTWTPPFSGEYKFSAQAIDDFGAIAISNSIAVTYIIPIVTEPIKKDPFFKNILRPHNGESVTFPVAQSDQSYASADIRNIRNKFIKRLSLSPQGFTWTGDDASGNIVPAGIYILTTRTRYRTYSHRIVVLR